MRLKTKKISDIDPNNCIKPFVLHEDGVISVAGAQAIKLKKFWYFKIELEDENN